MDPLLSLRSRLRRFMPYTTATVGGRAVEVQFGTFRRGTPTKDDAWLFHLLRESSVFFDIGCNRGLWSLIAAIDNPTRIIAAVDANPLAAATAADNLLRNGFGSRCRFAVCAVGASDKGETAFWTVGKGEAGSVFKGAAKTATKAGSHITVPMRTIDSLAAEWELTPDFVKIDVEGFEHDALTGAAKVASQHAARFFVEVHSPPERPMAENGTMILEWADRAGYDAWYLAEHLHVTDVGPFQHRGRCHLLLLPAGTAYPEGLAAISERDAPAFELRWR